jgi:hypothetical protein
VFTSTNRGVSSCSIVSDIFVSGIYRAPLAQLG